MSPVTRAAILAWGLVLVVGTLNTKMRSGDPWREVIPFYIAYSTACFGIFWLVRWAVS